MGLTEQEQDDSDETVVKDENESEFIQIHNILSFRRASMIHPQARGRNLSSPFLSQFLTHQKGSHLSKSGSGLPSPRRLDQLSMNCPSRSGLDIDISNQEQSR